MKKVSIFMAIAAAASLASCTAQAPKANLKSDLDSLSYSIGMAQTQGLKGYLTGRLDVDTAYMAEFIKGLNEGANKTSKKDIAYTYQVPSILLDVEGSTYSNFGEAKIEFYVNDIIPSAQNIMRVLNKIYGFTGFGFMPFFDHLEMFQPSKKDQAECMNSAVNYIGAAIQLGIMTPEEGRSELLKYQI